MSACGALSPDGRSCVRPDHSDRTHCHGRILNNGTREYSGAWVDGPPIGAVIGLPPSRREPTP